MSASRRLFVFAMTCLFVEISFQISQIEDSSERKTKIRLRPTNGSALEGRRADPEGPLIIDYPFPLHNLHNAQNSEYAIRSTNQLQQLSYAPAPTKDTHGSLYSYGRQPNWFYPPKKKRKKTIQKEYKHLIPLLITVVAKISHFLPTLKLVLLALFSLLLFAKKAFIISIATFILVLYEHFSAKYATPAPPVNSIGLWKDRGQAGPAAHDTQHNYDVVGGPDHTYGSDWWQLEGANGTKITPREGVKRWWAPQVKAPYIPPPLSPQLEEHKTLKDRIKTNIKKLFDSRALDSSNSTSQF